MKGGESMIIQSSRVNLASSREYTYSSGRNLTRTTTYGGRTNSFSQTWEKSYTARQDYYSSSGSDSYPATDSPGISYGLDKDGTLKIMDEETTEKTDSASETEPAKATDIGELIRYQDEITTRLFLSIMRLIHQLRFRAKFEGNWNYMNLRETAGQSLFQVEKSVSYYISETESTTFSGTGTAVTADGRNLRFNVDFTMSRSFMEEYQISSYEAYPYVFTDPLVINLDSNPVEISDQSFCFDLNCDGDKEEIAQLGSGSGYLSLDKNGDGIINDGSELFGAKTGDGFRELAAYDKDNNGWIDEADDIYSSLKVWKKDENGNDILLSLKEADVGAIYLGKTATDFTVYNDDVSDMVSDSGSDSVSNVADDSDSVINTSSGSYNRRPVARVRSSGIFLHEDGRSGVMHQMDF